MGYGIKLAECINGGDWNCLGDIYDQNWGMADGMHAVVFVDNHDNQRGHGGAGGVLTASNNVQGHDDWKYKIGAPSCSPTTMASRESCPATTLTTLIRVLLDLNLPPSPMLVVMDGLVNTDGAQS